MNELAHKSTLIVFIIIMPFYFHFFCVQICDRGDCS